MPAVASSPRPAVPVLPRAPAGSPWEVGPRTVPALAALGQPAPVRVEPGECAMFDARIGIPCRGASRARAELAPGAHLPVCQGHEHALTALGRKHGRPVTVTPHRP